MSDKKTDDIINTIVDEAGPVKQVRDPSVQAALWFGISFVAMALIGMMSGLRPDVESLLQTPRFYVEVILMLFTAFSGAYVASCFALPDTHQKWRLRWVPVASAVAFLLYMLSNVMLSEVEEVFAVRLDCSAEMWCFSFIPGLAMFFLLRQSASVHYRWAAIAGGLSVSSFGYLLLRLIEANDGPLHLLLWHVLPMALFTAFCAALGRWMLARW